jgi:hypothetical protein
MVSAAELSAPIWIAMIVIIFSLLYKIFLFMISRWYRDVYLAKYHYSGEGVVIPTELNFARQFFSKQPMYNNKRDEIVGNMPSPVKYIWVYLSAIATCIYLIFGMYCSEKGDCQMYAWIYVGFISLVFIVDMMKTIYDYSDWRNARNPDQDKIRYA